MELPAPDRTPWERALLASLQSASPAGVHTASYLTSHETALVIVENNATNLWWKVHLAWHGPHPENALYISRFLANKPPNSPWLMASIVHETRHLEQGFWTAFSVYGEMEAWQLGFNFYLTLPGHGAVSRHVHDLLALPLSHERAVLREAQRLINLDQNAGASFGSLVMTMLKKERAFNQIYWINALPLNPLFR